MRKVLAVASVGIQHKELIFKELKKIFKRVKISLDVLLQEEILHSQTTIIENGNIFASYPYITLTIPNYEQHREYLEKVYKNNVLFSKFILLISEGKDYNELVGNRNEEILREKCRNWNSSVSCSFESTPVFTDIEEQMSKIDKVLGEMDIRGKITEIDAKKKFHLIENHGKVVVEEPHPHPDPKVPSKATLLKLFFGLEVGCGRKARCGGAAWAAGNIVDNSNSNSSSEFMDYQEDEKMKDEDEETQDIEDQIEQQKIIRCGISHVRRSHGSQSGKIGGSKRHAKSRFEQPLASNPSQNPYLKKTYACEVQLSQHICQR